ncbi:hypothetical protein J6590_038360 [Homalodisca vitripennis]|nr:hypothetical protein J6590_038360 [Homalodisca vitripennis]
MDYELNVLLTFLCLVEKVIRTSLWSSSVRRSSVLRRRLMPSAAHTVSAATSPALACSSLRHRSLCVLQATGIGDVSVIGKKMKGTKITVREDCNGL